MAARNLPGVSYNNTAFWDGIATVFVILNGCIRETCPTYCERSMVQGMWVTLTNGSDRMPSESFFDCRVDVGRFRGFRGLGGITWQETLE